MERTFTSKASSRSSIGICRQDWFSDGPMHRRPDDPIAYTTEMPDSSQRPLMNCALGAATRLNADCSDPSRLHIQPPIVQRKWRIILGCLPRQVVQKLVLQLFRKPFQIWPQSHGGAKGA